MVSELFRLAGRVALVTGGSRGLGKAMATIFAEAGAAVVISSRHEGELQAAAAEIRGKTAARVEHVVADMTRRKDVQRLAAAAVDRMGKIDILVNNAGTNVPQAIDQIRDEDWDRLLELNLSSCMALTRAVAPGMKQRRWGRIIHISSIMGLASTAERNAYSATKAALLGLARASALDLGPFNITVNCIAPGPFATDMPMSILSAEQQAALAARTALDRWGRPEELAGPALLLASEAGSYITGTVLVVDGGALAKVFESFLAGCGAGRNHSRPRTICGPQRHMVRKALPGVYKIEACDYFVAPNTLLTPVTVQVDVFTTYGRANEKHQSLAARLQRVGDQVTVGSIDFNVQ